MMHKCIFCNFLVHISHVTGFTIYKIILAVRKNPDLWAEAENIVIGTVLFIYF